MSVPKYVSAPWVYVNILHSLSNILGIASVAIYSCNFLCWIRTWISLVFFFDPSLTSPDDEYLRKYVIIFQALIVCFEA